MFDAFARVEDPFQVYEELAVACLLLEVSQLLSDQVISRDTGGIVVLNSPGSAHRAVAIEYHDERQLHRSVRTIFVVISRQNGMTDWPADVLANELQAGTYRVVDIPRLIRRLGGFLKQADVCGFAARF